MMLPTIHLNGSAPAHLRENYERAYRAVGEAIDALQQAHPNARDYYPQGPHAIKQAQEEHERRLKTLEEMRTELLTLYEACDRPRGTR